MPQAWCTSRRRSVALHIDACIGHDIRFSPICWRNADRAINKLAAKVVRQHADRADRDKIPESVYDLRIGIETAHRRVVQPFLRTMHDEDRMVDWSDPTQFAVQDCIDGWRVLRKAAVHVPAAALIKTQLSLIFP
jgi:hypothetical protein